MTGRNPGVWVSARQNEPSPSDTEQSASERHHTNQQLLRVVVLFLFLFFPAAESVKQTMAALSGWFGAWLLITLRFSPLSAQLTRQDVAQHSPVCGPR